MHAVNLGRGLSRTKKEKTLTGGQSVRAYSNARQPERSGPIVRGRGYQTLTNLTATDEAANRSPRLYLDDEARRIAANIVKLPGLLHRPQY